MSRYFPVRAISAAAAALALLLTPLAPAQALTRADCERDYQPQVGQGGKDVVWVPTPDDLVSRMLRMAKTAPQDYVIDLGAGDGKIAIAAAKEFGATSLGIEYNADMVKLAQCLVQVEGMGNRARIIHGDIFKEDFSTATVLTMYLLPELNLCIRHRVLAMKPGTRVSSHEFPMGDWQADEHEQIGYRMVYLWIVPARVGGTWMFRDADGKINFRVFLTQAFQKISGDATAGALRQPIVGATLRGHEIRFAFNDDKGVTRTFSGAVDGKEMAGSLRSPGGGEVKVTATLLGGPQIADWTEMAPNCGRFYSK